MRRPSPPSCSAGRHTTGSLTFSRTCAAAPTRSTARSETAVPSAPRAPPGCSTTAASEILSVPLHDQTGAILEHLRARVQRENLHQTRNRPRRLAQPPERIRCRQRAGSQRVPAQPASSGLAARDRSKHHPPHGFWWEPRSAQRSASSRWRVASAYLSSSDASPKIGPPHAEKIVAVTCHLRNVGDFSEVPLAEASGLVVPPDWRVLAAPTLLAPDPGFTLPHVSGLSRRAMRAVRASTLRRRRAGRRSPIRRRYAEHVSCVISCTYIGNRHRHTDRTLRLHS